MSAAIRVLRLISSPRGAESESLRLSHLVLDGLAGQHSLQVQDVDLNDLQHVDRDYAMALASPSDADQAEPGSALQRSAELISQLDEADVLLIATPMHNYTVPSTLKAWVDHIVRIRMTFNGTPQGKVGLLRDCPVYVALASGGLISGEQARQPDFLRPYLQAALATVGLRNMHFFCVEGTARGEQALLEARAMAQSQVAAFFSAE
ncbi:NAD(P)H dehydrogenase [Ectopseudomonas toyotomiensis]|uniref:FMN dependent NADH:quinone oxidoreductase n=1 Tax=Ectopseudomonas toyotomiensis TaxID=554344 RepID=A0A1I5TPT1_9GAMM|nr:NAD(P)H-dependent oxidoreductase [Pseudomonas toyotomiensis]PIA73779.1 NAD(P)H dehydrogenase [Pseudomonas toyotomiensis]SFP85055.1 FMN-dependent NADH-azoreductase [Pseudomonas toyotomiensis]